MEIVWSRQLRGTDSTICLLKHNLKKRKRKKVWVGKVYHPLPEPPFLSMWVGFFHLEQEREPTPTCCSVEWHKPLRNHPLPHTQPPRRGATVRPYDKQQPLTPSPTSTHSSHGRHQAADLVRGFFSPSAVAAPDILQHGALTRHQWWERDCGTMTGYSYDVHCLKHNFIVA